MSIEMSIKQELDAIVFSISGEIDICTLEVFQKEIFSVIKESSRPMTINCSDLKYIDSYGLSVFEKAYFLMRNKNLDLKLINVKKNIYKLLVITKLDQILLN